MKDQLASFHIIRNLLVRYFHFFHFLTYQVGAGGDKSQCFLSRAIYLMLSVEDLPSLYWTKMMCLIYLQPFVTYREL